jgi:hypothetical protein
MTAEDITLELGQGQAVEVSGVRKHLRHHCAPGLGIPGQLHLDDDRPARAFDCDQVGVSIPEPDFATEDSHAGRTSKR